MEETKELSKKDKEMMVSFYTDLAKVTTKEDIEKFYKKHINIYDEVNDICQYRQSAVCVLAKKLANLFPNVSSKSVIDIGAGTGLIGKELSNLGFQTIDGLDMTKIMLDECKKTKVYRNLYETELTLSPTKGIKDDTYDAAISVGCFIGTHIPLETLEEITRMVKPGGYIVYALKDPDFTMNYMEVQGRFMKEKKLQLISMVLEKHRLECENFEFLYAYQVIFKVL